MLVLCTVSVPLKSPVQLIGQGRDARVSNGMQYCTKRSTPFLCCFHYSDLLEHEQRNYIEEKRHLGVLLVDSMGTRINKKTLSLSDNCISEKNSR